MLDEFGELTSLEIGLASAGLAISLAAFLLRRWLLRRRARVRIQLVSPRYNRATGRLEVSVAATIVPRAPHARAYPRTTCAVKLGGLRIPVVEEQELRRQQGSLWTGRFVAYADVNGRPSSFRVKVKIRDRNGGRAARSERRLQVLG